MRPTANPPDLREANRALTLGLALRNDARKLEYIQVFGLIVLPLLVAATYSYWSPFLDPHLSPTSTEPTTKTTYTLFIAVLVFTANLTIQFLYQKKTADATALFQLYDSIVTQFSKIYVPDTKVEQQLLLNKLATEVPDPQPLPSWYSPLAYQSKSPFSYLYAVCSAIYFDLALFERTQRKYSLVAYTILATILIIIITPAFFANAASVALTTYPILTATGYFIFSYVRRFIAQKKTLLEITSKLVKLREDVHNMTHASLDQFAANLSKQLFDLRKDQLWLPQRSVYSVHVEACNNKMIQEVNTFAAALARHEQAGN